MNKQVGQFDIDVSNPSPAWVTIRYGHEDQWQVIQTIHPTELYDLQYAITCALRELERMGDQL